MLAMRYNTVLTEEIRCRSKKEAKAKDKQRLKQAKRRSKKKYGPEPAQPFLSCLRHFVPPAERTNALSAYARREATNGVQFAI
jgi:hypothetical protein